jgi:hypothetical protein
MNKYTGVEVKTHNRDLQYENKRMKLVAELIKSMLQSCETSKEYLVHQYNLTDIDVKSIDYEFINNFDYFLRQKEGSDNLSR